MEINYLLRFHWFILRKNTEEITPNTDPPKGNAKLRTKSSYHMTYNIYSSKSLLYQAINYYIRISIKQQLTENSKTGNNQTIIKAMNE